MTIDSKDISVIVQGAINKKETPKCIKSIRKCLPNAEIILSTWEGADATNLEEFFDIVIYNKDPGAVIFEYVHKLYNNTNRQLVSTQNGIKVANKRYILKLRTDFYLRGREFLYFWDKFPKTDKKYKVFNHRVIVSSVYSRIFSDMTMMPMPFHPSDSFIFGEKDDIKKYFLNTQQASQDDLANYKCKYDYKRPYMLATYRYTPEQYICFNFFKQFFHDDIVFEDWTDWNRENFILSESLLFNNFIFLDLEQSGICSSKHYSALVNSKNIFGLVTFDFFVNRYNEMFPNDKYNINDFINTKLKLKGNMELFFSIITRVLKKFLI